MGKIIAVANQKGGVGKTTTVVNLAGYLSKMGKSVLLVDIDPQGNASSGLGIDTNTLDKTIYQLLIGESSASEIIRNLDMFGLRLIPANVHLSGIEVDLLTEERREYRLKDGLESVKKDFDYILIDSPPNLGVLTLNALCAADSVIIPLQTEYYALEGLTQLMKIISLVQNSLNPNLTLEGVVLTMYDSRTSLANQVVEDVKSHFKDKTYNSVIPRNIRLSEAPSYGKYIGDYAPDSTGAKAYEEFAKEVISRG
jgi:chromosome partitioning protein